MGISRIPVAGGEAEELAVPAEYHVANPGLSPAGVDARGAKLRWQRVMADYLELRRSLAGIVLMIDSRLGFTDLDRQLLEFIGPRISNGAVKLLVLITKSDKLNRNQAAVALASGQSILVEAATDSADIGIALFSALKRTGVDEAAVVVHRWAGLTAAE
jgi:GTP-binding protein